MHELTLLKDLIEKIESVAREQNAKRVKAVRVRLGALSHISAAHFREHFEQVVRNTSAENAVLSVREETDQNDPNAQEIILESIDIEE